MGERIIETEGDSLEEARTKLSTDNLIVLDEHVLCRGRVEAIESIAGSVEEALSKANSKIPAGARIESQRVKIAPKRVMLRVAGDDEESAGKGKAEIIESVTLHKQGRKGFLGIGRTQNVYEVVIFQQAVVELRFREKARLLAIVKDYLAHDLLRNIQELRGRDAQWEEILQSLNPKKEEHVKDLLNRLLIPDVIDLHAALDIIENRCRQNERANWKKVIEEAHIEVSEIRKRLRVELRGLDQELADVFMFYTSIDWYPKSNREPTGIPMHTRSDYGNHPPDPRHRKIIPHYSTDSESFKKLKERAKEFGTYELCKQFLAEEGQDETSATMKQKCMAILKARRLQLRRER